MLTRTRTTLIPAVLLGLALGVAGCGTDEKKDASAKPTPPTTSQEPESYYPVPAGVTLTEPGTQLELGEEGVIAFARSQTQVDVVALTVERIERTSFQESFPSFEIDDATAARTPYFVRLSVTNKGDNDLGGRMLDNVVWADDGTNLEAPVHYSKKVLPVCAGDVIPESFPVDTTIELCQVYFVAPDRTLQAISFIPPSGLEPVTWSGELSKVTKPEKKKPRKPGKKARKKTS